ncbi:MAG: restriction endonuclease [Planctomycetes bacterium]|nr:restriction endonuclease [Planctomycetota bacterium]
MASQEQTLWGIHAPKGEGADNLFYDKNLIAIGWAKVGDLAALPDREALKAKVAECYPDKKAGAIPVDAGTLYRFAQEMQEGDVVVHHSRREHLIYLGKVTGPYRHMPDLSNRYPNVRSVKWLGKHPRTRFSQGALYEIGSAMALFQVKNYADEFVAALEGKAPAEPADDDETVSLVAEEIEQTTQDFVLKRLAQELKGHGLESFVGHLLQIMGYQTRVSPEGPDGGIDILAHKDELGFEPPIIKVQVKSTEGSIGDPAVSALYGKVGEGEFGLLVNLGRFTKQAENFARSKSNLRLIDGAELVSLILRHYEQLDSRYKGLIPLKHVYVPQAVEEPEE